MRVRVPLRWSWLWIGAVLVAAVALGVVGFSVAGWLGTGIGAAVGVVVPLVVGVASTLLGQEGAASSKIRISIGEDSLHLWSLTADEFERVLNQLLGPRVGVHDDFVRSALAELVQPGRLLFNPPDRMRLGETERVEVRLTRAIELDAELLKQLRGHGEPQLEEILTAVDGCHAHG